MKINYDDLVYAAEKSVYQKSAHYYLENFEELVEKPLTSFLIEVSQLYMEAIRQNKLITLRDYDLSRFKSTFDFYLLRERPEDEPAWDVLKYKMDLVCRSNRVLMTYHKEVYSNYFDHITFSFFGYPKGLLEMTDKIKHLTFNVGFES